MNTKGISTSLLLYLSLAYSLPSHSAPVRPSDQLIRPSQFISAPQSEVPGLFGFDLVLSDQHLFISNPDKGSVYHYLRRKDGKFTLHTTLEPPRSHAFGWAMAINRQELAISDPLNSVVYFYKLSDRDAIYSPPGLGWNPINDFMGGSLAMDDELLLIGRPLNEHQRGAVDVYTKINQSWTFLNTLKGNSQCIHFGSQIVLGEQYAAIFSTTNSYRLTKAWNSFLLETVKDEILENQEGYTRNLMTARVKELPDALPCLLLN